MLSFSHVSLQKGKQLILNDVTFDVAPGEFVCIVGPSGSGKTSLLELLLGLEKPSKGTVSVDEIDLAILPPTFLQVYRQSIGYLPQQDLLFPHENVATNVALPLRIRKMKREDVEQRVAHILSQLGLIKRAASLPHELTQSERKKLSLARTLVGAPAILLADEPTGNLDQSTAREILHIIKDAHRRGTTVILATPNALLAKSFGTRILLLERGALTESTRSTVAPLPEKSPPPHARITPTAL